ATTVLDSILFRDTFGTPRMREVFSDHALISRYIEVEIALARAQARCDVIPPEAAEQIAARCNVASLDFDLLRHETDLVGYPILPLVHQLAKQCGDAGRYIHWGQQLRTSWIPRSRSRSARLLPSLSRRLMNYAASWRKWPRNIATLRW